MCGSVDEGIIMEDIIYKYLTWNDIELACLNIYDQMVKNKYKPDCIIGLSRGGVIPGRLFSDYFDVVEYFFSLDVKMYTGIKKTMEEAIIRPFHEEIKGKCLVVDDIWDSGMTMRAVLEYLKGKDITTATLYWNGKIKDRPDYYCHETKCYEWISFPWEKFETDRMKTQ